MSSTIPYLRIVEDDGVTPYVLPPDPFDNPVDTGFTIAIGNGDTMSRTRNHSPDKSGRNARLASDASSGGKKGQRTNSFLPGRNMSDVGQTSSTLNKSALGSTFSEYAYREAEGYHTVNHAIRTCLRDMATEGWRSHDDKGDTVIHCVLQVRSHGFDAIHVCVCAPSWPLFELVHFLFCYLECLTAID